MKRIGAQVKLLEAIRPVLQAPQEEAFGYLFGEAIELILIYLWKPTLRQQVPMGIAHYVQAYIPYKIACNYYE